MSASSRAHYYLSLPGPVADDGSPSSARSVASDSSFEEQFSTPLPYLDSSPQPAVAPPPGALRRSTSAPYQPSLRSFQESPAAPHPRRLNSHAPPSLPLLAEQPPRHPHLSLSVNGGDDSALSSSPQPATPQRKPRSHSLSSPGSPDESPSPLVELSPMHKKFTARAGRAMSVGSSQAPRLSFGHYSPARSSPAETKEDSGKVVDVADGGAFDYWPMDDDTASDLDEAASPPALATTRYPSLRSIYRSSPSNAPSACVPCSKPRLRRYCGSALRCAFFSLFVIAFFLFTVVVLMQFRAVTLYTNNVCRPLDSVAGASTDSTPPSSLIQPLDTASTMRSVIHTQTTLPRSKVYVVFWNVLNSFFGLPSLLRYSANSLLSAVTRRIRVPTGFSSSAPLFTPNYTGSPLLALPLNHFRYIGSHNSYHLKSSYPIPAHQYAHAPLPAQLGDYSDGVRQIELDIHVVEGRGGSVMYHVQMLDDHTNCYCLTECLLLVRQWSLTYPQHYPVMLMIEFKRQAYEDMLNGLNGLTCNDLYNLEVALLDVFPPGSFLLPRDVRGSFPDILSALTYRSYLDRKTNRWNSTAPSQRPTAAEDAAMAPYAQYAATNVSFGWPSVGAMLGRFILVWLDDVFNYADRLPCVTDDPSSQHIALFVAQAKWNRSYCAVQVNRDPLVDWDLNKIQSAIDRGMIVRTLSTTAQVSRRDTQRYQAALQYGLHVLSSDFEAPCAGNERSAGNLTVSTARGGDGGRNVSIASWLDANHDDVFCERLPSGWPFECHPQLSPPWCQEELNRIRVDGLAEAARLNTTGQAEQLRLERLRVAAMGTVFAGMEDG